MARTQHRELLQEHVNPAVLENAIDANFIEEDEEGRALIDVTTLHIPDVITLTARLAQLLAEEADLLEEMKVHKISTLQKEKLTLIAALEAQYKQVRKTPQLLEAITANERAQLKRVVDVFDMVREENIHRLKIARAVNQRMIQAIAEVVAESNSNGLYDEKGNHDKPAYAALSVTLNEKI